MSCRKDMKLQQTVQGIVLDVQVKPNSKEFQIKFEDGELVVFCRETPLKGRVNRELIRELSRLFKRRVEIVSGFSSRRKRILVGAIKAERVAQFLQKGMRKDENQSLF